MARSELRRNLCEDLAGALPASEAACEPAGMSDLGAMVVGFDDPRPRRTTMDPELRDTLARALPPQLFAEVVADAAVLSTGDWVARSRAFALFEPIRSAAQFLRVSLAKRKLAGGRALERYDFEGLLLEAVDRVVDHYGLGESLTTEALGEKLAGFLEQNEQALGRAPDPGWCRTVAQDAIDVLLNRRPRIDDIVETPHTAYVHRHLVPGTVPRTSAFGFLLLEEATEDGRRVIRARQEAVLFTVRMLDFDLEEMGEVLQDLLERQMKRGNFAGARRTAEQGRQVANSYAAQIRAQLDEARRRPLASGYARHLAPVLERARAHLDERTAREHVLWETVDRLRLEAVAPDVGAALDVIARELTLSNCVYASLMRAIAAAPGEHEARRARAFLGRVAPGTWPAPLEEVLVPALRLPAATVEAAGPTLLRRVSPPIHPRLFDLASFIRRAFRPAPAPQSLDPEREPDPVRPLPRPDLALDEAHALLRRRASGAPAGVWLSALIAAAGDPALVTALGLVAHEARRATPGDEFARGWRVVEVGPRRTLAGVTFDDLRVAAMAVVSPIRSEEVSHVGV